MYSLGRTPHEVGDEGKHSEDLDRAIMSDLTGGVSLVRGLWSLPGESGGGAQVGRGAALADCAGVHDREVRM